MMKRILLWAVFVTLAIFAGLAIVYAQEASIPPGRKMWMQNDAHQKEWHLDILPERCVAMGKGMGGGAICVSGEVDRLSSSHRWASDLLKEKRTDGTVWKSNLPAVWREVPDCNYGSGALTTAMRCPAQTKETYTIDVCLIHGETRVLHSAEKQP